jgi:hypothetical protein
MTLSNEEIEANESKGSSFKMKDEEEEIIVDSPRSSSKLSSKDSTQEQISNS